jgi:dTDP-4-amino-4,6-dideoxygalactose transaminase
MLAGKHVRYAEVSEDDFNMIPAALEGVVTADTAVLATHQFGIPCDVQRILEICRCHGAFVIEDVAAALGTRINGQLAGTFGDAAFFSFDCTKLIQVPLKGGAVLVRDPELFQKIQEVYRAEIQPMPLTIKARWLAMAAAMLVIECHMAYRLFYKFRFRRQDKFTAETADLKLQRSDFYRYDMANWQAYVASRQMERIEEIIQRLMARYARYGHLLAGCRAFALPPPNEGKQWACIRFPIRVHSDKLAFYRQCAQRGVDFAFSFTYITTPSVFTSAHRLANSVLDLPYYSKLRDEELQTVVDVLKSVEAEVLAK